MVAANRLLIQVVPQLKPAQCGVSDHAILLARELKSAFGIESAFVVLNSAARCSLPYSVVYCAPEGLLAACLSLSRGRPGAILVHLSGYGYSADGAPTLLAEALENVKSDGRFRVAVYFHELFATGMPWRSAFWHTRKQKRAVKRIAETGDWRGTNTRHHASWLRRQLVRRDAIVENLPVFSTIGETEEQRPVAQREPSMAVFGLPATRQRAYRDLRSMKSLLRDLGVQKILDVGPECEIPLEMNGIPVICTGALTAGEIASRFSQTMYGFLSHTPSCLAKSSIFASYCAQGTIPVIAKSFSGEVDGLTDGVQVISSRTLETARTAGFQPCSTAAWLWYSGHRLHAHAATYARWFDELERRQDAKRI
jgi:hypothetical protein